MTPLAPQVRSEFAKRLKIIRTQRGFPRARYFASTLGIEENRYTRYERAEVEPSLTLIHKMCETLGITPNELLGFEPVRAREGLAGFAETAQAREPGDPREAIAWQLAFLIIGRDPVRYRPLMLAAMVEKFSFALALLGLHLSGSSVPAQVLAGGAVDFVLGLLFIWAWVRTGREA